MKEENRQEQVKKKIAEGNSLREKGNLEAAITTYQEALEINPNNPGVYRFLGMCLGKQGKLEEAIASYQKAIEIQPSFWLYKELGDLFREKQELDLDEAIKAYQEAIKIEEDRAIVYRFLGICQEKKGLLGEAIASYKKAINLNEQPSFWLYKDLGEALSQQGEIDEAIKAYQKAVKLKPDNYGFYLKLAELYQKKGNFEKVIKNYQQAKKLQPELSSELEKKIEKINREKLVNSLQYLGDMKISENNKPLVAVLCGFEHSGTTMLSEMLRQHPKLDSGFEGGFLLNENARDFLTCEPFYTNLKGGWGVNDEDLRYICAVDTWGELYARLREKAGVIKDKNTWIFDKTPRYMQVLPQVLERVPGVPCIVIVRDFRSVLWSSYKRTGLTIDEWYKKTFKLTCNHTLSYCRGWKEAMEKGYGERILLIQYEDLCVNKDKEAKKIFDFLELEFEESYLSFEERRYAHVKESQVSTKYLTEYKGNLPEEICQEAIKVTEEYKDWLWLNDE